MGCLVDVVADSGDVRAEGGRVGVHAHGVHAAVHEHVVYEPHVGGVAASSPDQVVQLPRQVGEKVISLCTGRVVDLSVLMLVALGAYGYGSPVAVRRSR